MFRPRIAASAPTSSQITGAKYHIGALDTSRPINPNASARPSAGTVSASANAPQRSGECREKLCATTKIMAPHAITSSIGLCAIVSAMWHMATARPSTIESTTSRLRRMIFPLAGSGSCVTNSDSMRPGES
jgi:hypothetical protein